MGEYFVNKFILLLEEYGIVIDCMCGQGYDGVVNMVGKYRGVQVKNVCKELFIWNLMDIVQIIFFVFDYLVKCLKQFNELLLNDNLIKE